MKKLLPLILTALAFLLAACGPKEDPIEPTPANVVVSGVTLNQSTLALKIGERRQDSDMDFLRRECRQG